ncbi:MAG: hypothetical protein SPJ97_00125 [Bacteroides sp.]|nr:hypothetical protein [Bacteroides sp.]
MYKRLFSNYAPAEKGDFLIKYLIDDQSFVVYSPEEGKVSCFTLDGFKEITPSQIALILNIDFEDDKNPDEEDFDLLPCSKELVINYLFDVLKDGGEENPVLRNVSGKRAYILHSLRKDNIVKNLYEYSLDKEEATIVFDDKCCWYGENVQSDNPIALSWNPIAFEEIKVKYPDHGRILMGGHGGRLVEYIIDKFHNHKLMLPTTQARSSLYFLSILKGESGPRTFRYYEEDNTSLLRLVNWDAKEALSLALELNKEGGVGSIYSIEKIRENVFYIIFPSNEFLASILLNKLSRKVEDKELYDVF